MSNETINSPEKIKAMTKGRADKEKAEYSSAEKDKPDSSGQDESAYFIKGGYLCRKKFTKDGAELTIPLCNFAARIVEENIVDDGKELNHLYKIEGKLCNKIPLPMIELPATNFSNLAWVSKWGSKPCLEPGNTVRDFVRHSIQKASDDVKVTTHYAHTGWRNIDGNIVYLHAGGAVGCDSGVSVKLSRELEKYCLPSLPTQTESATPVSDTEKKGMEASLAFLDIGKREVTLPLWCLVYLAPLTTLLNPMPNFSVYLYGQSGTFKTTAAILALSHFGNFSGVESLSNFDDTIGILEKRSFTLKDSLHIVDDYHPSANRRAAENKETVAQKMIRSHSNRTARGRLNPDMSERGRYEPRSMMLMTAEEIPALESTLARVCIVEITEGAIDLVKLSNVQAESEFLPFCMVAYLQWLRENMTDIKESFPKRFFELRQRATNEGFHKKLPEQAAFMGFALETATAFFQDKGMMSEVEASDLVSEGWRVWRQLAAKQQARIRDDDPVTLFEEILSTLLIQHNARLECLPGHDGGRIGAGNHVGYYDASYLYLMPTALWNAMQKFCISENTHFPFSKHTFFQMLKNRKIIMPSPSGNPSIQVKIEGNPIRFLKVIDGGIYAKCVTFVTK